MENANLRKKESVACCILPKFRPQLGCVFFSFSPWLWSLNSKPIFPLACVDLSLEAQGRKGQEKLQTLLTTAAACLGGGVSQGDGGQQHLGVEVTLNLKKIALRILCNGIG